MKLFTKFVVRRTICVDPREFVERLITQCYDADHLPSSDDEDDALLQRNRRIHRRVREPAYDMWDDDNIGGYMQDTFAEPLRIMAEEF